MPHLCPTGSDCSSEHSIGGQSVGSESVSSRNTLLASGTSRPVKLTQLEENMRNMDLDDTLLNPDKLWERKHSGYVHADRLEQKCLISLNRWYREANFPRSHHEKTKLSH